MKRTKEKADGKATVSNRDRTLKLTECAVCAALAIVLMLVVRFPIFPSAPYLEYDMGDVPVLVADFLFGPVSGLVCLAVVSAIQAFTVSSAAGYIGFLMHFIASGSFVVLAGVIYRMHHSRRDLFFGLIAGIVIMTGLMVPLNMLLTPLYSGMPQEAVLDLLLPVTIPFNLIKGGINSAVTFLMYEMMRGILLKSDLLPSDVAAQLRSAPNGRRAAKKTTDLTRHR